MKETEMRCPECDRRVVELAVQGLSRFMMRACTHCDHRVWTIDGRPCGVEDVARAIRSREQGLRVS